MRLCGLLLMACISCLSLAKEELPSLEIKQIEDGVFLHRSYSHVAGWGLVSSNGLVVVDQGQAFIVDTPWSNRDTKQLVNWIKGKGYKLLGSISTHSHEDRTAGIQWLNEHSIATYATALTNRILAEQGKEKAKHSIETKEYELADRLLEVFYPGGGHTIDNLVVWLPKSKILFGGCLVRSQNSKSLGYTGEAHIEQWVSSIEKTITKYPEAKRVVPGHGKIADFELLNHTKNLAQKALNKLQDSASKEIKN